MAKSKKKKKRKQEIENLQAKLSALQMSHKRLLRDQQHHFDFDVVQVKKSLRRAIDRHKLKPDQPIDAETMESLRDAHATIGLLQNLVATSRRANFGEDIPSHDPNTGNDIPSHCQGSGDDDGSECGGNITSH